MEQADAAVVDLRRALTNGTDPVAAILSLAEAATVLMQTCGQVSTSTGTSAADAPSSVTESITEPDAEAIRDVHAVEPHQTASPDGVDLPEPLQRGEQFDLDSVRMEKGHSYEWDGQWTVVAGIGPKERLIGHLSPHVTRTSARGKGWRPLGAGMMPLGRTRYRTRKEALLALLDHVMTTNSSTS